MRLGCQTFWTEWCWATSPSHGASLVPEDIADQAHAHVADMLLVLQDAGLSDDIHNGFAAAVVEVTQHLESGGSHLEIKVCYASAKHHFPSGC